MDRATTIDTATAASRTMINPHRTRLRRPARAARFCQVDRGRQTLAGAGVGSLVRDRLASAWTTVA
jgi:hypothetical protein